VERGATTRKVLTAACMVLLGTVLLAGSVHAGPVSYVVHVSVDGLNAGLLQALLANDNSGQYANFQRLVDEGASTFNARTDYSNTRTLPNHTSMLTGRPVLQPAGQANTVHHGYTSNDLPGSTATLHNQGNGNLVYIASVFDVVHDSGLTTGLYSSKTKFVIYEQSYNAANGAIDVTGADDGRDKIDRYVNMQLGNPAYATNLHAAFISELATDPQHYSFVHYRDPDTDGHVYGWGSAQWNASVHAVDGYVGDILTTIESSPTLQGRTVLLLTTDHGGFGLAHSDSTVWSNFRVPVFVWGSLVYPGIDLYEHNAGTRTDPGTGRPDYNASPPIRNADTANLALDLLGLGPIPGSSINASQDLEVLQDSVPVSKRTMTGIKSLYR